MVTVKVKKVKEGVILPTQATKGSACYDLYLPDDFCMPQSPMEPILVPLGIVLEIPHGYVGILSLRSSISLLGFSMPNGIGVIDSDYRGELGLPLCFPFGNYSEFFKAGTRIAQIRLEKVIPLEIQECENLSETERGEGGFGSTGK